MTNHNCTTHQNHNTSACKVCSNMFNFFSKFEHTLDVVDEDQDTMIEPELTSELKQMRASIPDMSDSLKHYMAHHVRAQIQFDAIKKNMNQLHGSNCIIVMDHKQKVLPDKYREGQVEYFGKL